MNITHRPIFLMILVLTLLLPGCRTAKVPVASQESAELKPVWTSEGDKLRSTVMLVEATRQKTLGNWSQATVLYHDAITADPGNDAAHFELAKIHAMQGQFEDALSYAKKAVELSPGNSYYLAALADIYVLSNNLGPAISAYEDLVNTHPGRTDFVYNLATAYLFSNQKEKALNMFMHLESLVGFSEEISIEKQKIWVELKQYDKAIEEARKLISLFPDEIVYYELLGDLYREAGQVHEAGKMYQAMLQAEPDNALAQLLVADYYLETGDHNAAFELLEQAFRNPLLDKESKARIIYRYYLMAEEDPLYLDEALKLSVLLTEFYPNDPEPYLIQGDFLSRAGQLEASRSMYLQAVSMDPSQLSVWQQILSIDGRLSDYEAMKEHSDMALEYFFEQPVLFLFNGLANLQLKHYEDAASSLEYGLVIAAEDQDLKTDFLSLLGDTYHYLDNHERSDRYYEMVLETNPENAVVLNNYSYHLAVRKERLDEAEQMSKLANELESDNAAFLDTYGWIMYQKSRYEEARVWIERSLQQASEPSASVLEHYGDVLYRLGQQEDALNYWKQAREAGEGSPFLEKKINDKTLYE